VIASTYTGRAFGFASRNFYAEFLAAAKIYRNRDHHFPGLLAADPLAFEEFRPAQFVKVGELAKKAELDLDVLRELNPALSKAVWENRLRLPKGYALKVPPGKAAALQTAYAALPAEFKSDVQGGGRHVVRSGDTLGKIAAQYGTTVGALQSANRLASAHRLHVGQQLIVPGREEPAKPLATATTLNTPVAAATPADPPTRLAATATPAVKPGESDAGGGSHVVRKGDTLDAIARRYGVSVDSLRRANNLRNHVIHPAQVLVIPDAP
jgi:membrane-bound lytic murein transglycosylase D